MTSTQDQKQASSNSQSDYKKNLELISNWYQSYYLWNNAFMVNAILSSGLALNGNKVACWTQPSITPSNPEPNFQAQRNQTSQRVTSVQQVQPQLRQYKIPSLFKRFWAEFFDAIYIQCCKIIMAILLITYTDLIDEDSYRFFDFIEDILSEENLNNIRLPMELLLLELVYVLISVAFESFCLYRKGYTPGKYLFNLKVISCSHVTENLANHTFQVFPGTPLSLKSIIIRTSLKNFSIVFLFPTIVFFLLPAFTEYGQTSYDKAVDSIVVEGI